VQREEQVERPDDVVHLREHRVFAVDHGVGRGALLGEVDDDIGLEGGDRLREGGVARHVGDEDGHRVARERLPHLDPLVERPDGREALDSELVVPQAAREVVENANLVSTRRQMQCGRPAAVTIPSQHENPHTRLLPVKMHQRFRFAS